jgi:predicted dehydrogenase
MIRVGILGPGFMGTTHARAYARQPDVQVVAVWSRDPRRAAVTAAETGARTYPDAQSLLADPTVDAVSITLPTHLHAAYAVAALEAGKHVIVEKPMALSIDQCDAMIRARAQTGRVLMVAHVLRFWPEYVAVYDYVRSGVLGAPLSITAYRLLGQSAPGGWYEDPAQSGGAVLDLHIHDLDACNWFFGAPRTVYARGCRGSAGAWQHALTLLDYGSAQGMAEGSAIQPEGYPFTMGMRVTCERGAVEFGFRAGGAQVDSRDRATSEITVFPTGGPPQRIPSPGGDGYENEIAEFLACIREHRAPVNGAPEQARLAVATALAARDSLETGEVVTLLGLNSTWAGRIAEYHESQ